MRVGFVFLFLLSGHFASAQTQRAFGYQDLQTLISEKNITSIEELIPALPVDLRSHFTLMHGSVSAQGSSLENPRAILFGLDAKFILTFNGESSQRNFNRVETMEFSDEDKKFNFRTISFTGTGPQKGKAIYDTDQTRCLGCHGDNINNLHPVWQDYDLWRGAYGEYDDAFEPFNGNLITHLSDYQKFLQKKDSHARYKNLIFNQASTLSPYQDQGSKGFNLALRPNLHLSLLLTRYNAKRIADQFETAPSWKTNPVALIRKLAGCDVIHYPEPYLEALRQIEATRFVRHNAFLEFGGTSDYMGQQEGLDVRNWFLQIGPRFPNFYYDGSDSTPFQNMVATFLIQSLIPSRPDLLSILPEKPNDSLNAFLGASPRETAAVRSLGTFYTVTDQASVCAKLLP